MNAFTLSVMMYHYVRQPGDVAEASSGIPGLSPARFAAQLDYLTRHYDMISWPDLREFLMGHKPLPPRAALLTFDDGVRDHYLNVFPALSARGLSGLFFAMARQPGAGLVLGHKIHYLLARLGVAGLREAVWRRLSPAQQDAFLQAESHYRALRHLDTVDLLKAVLQRHLSMETEEILSQLIAEHIGPEAEIAREFYLTKVQISEMAANGMHFGGHSRRHPWFDCVEAAYQAEEIEASADGLREIESGPWAFAYPYGAFSAQAPQLLQTHGFAAAFTTVEQITQAEPFFIGRLDGESFAPDMIQAQTRVES